MADSPEPGPTDRDVDDGALLRRLQSGDEAALNEIVEAYWGPLLWYVRSFLPADPAEDVAQETFVRLWDGRCDWDPRGGINGLVYRIARNLAIDEQRRRKVRLDWRSRQGDETGFRFAGPAALAEESEIQEAVARAVDALAPRRREVFTLARFHGLTYREIAEVTALAEQTVANHMSAALADLRRALAPWLKDLS